MKRPNKEDYTFFCEHTVTTKLSRYYVPELEAYCNELEKENKKLEKEILGYQKLLDIADSKIIELEKLARWKEWLLNGQE